MFRVLAVAVLISLAQSQNTGDWYRIGTCNDPNNADEDRDDFPMEMIQAMAQNADSVKICSGQGTYPGDDCVTSIANTFPILNLREGVRLLSHSDSGNVPCNQACAQRTWTGSANRMRATWTTCGNYNSRNPSSGVFGWFHACNNHLGIHIGYPHGLCGWNTATPSEGGMSIYINSGSAPPTVSPSASPSNWFEDPTHQTNFIEMQSRMTAAELSIAGLLNDGEDEARDSRMEASLSTLTSQVGTLMDSVRNLQSTHAGNVTELTQSGADQSTALSAMQQASRDQGAEISTLKSALQAAVTATGVGSPARCSGNACAPIIEASGANIAIKAPNGAVEISSGSCGPVDVCGVAAFTQSLKDSLRDY